MACSSSLSANDIPLTLHSLIHTMQLIASILESCLTPLSLLATLAHTSLLPIKSNVLKLNVAQELKLALAVNKGPELGFSCHG